MPGSVGGRRTGVPWPSLIVDETSMTSDGIFVVGRIMKDVGKISFVILVSEGLARETNTPGVLPNTLWELAVALRKVSEVVHELTEVLVVASEVVGELMDVLRLVLDTADGLTDSLRVISEAVQELTDDLGVILETL